MTSFALDESLKKYVKKPSDKIHPEFVLVYGPPGCGKTWIAASASELPHVKKVLILDTEGSTSGTISDFDEDKIDIIPAEDIQLLDAVLAGFFDPDLETQYDVLIIDTFDVAQAYKIKQLLAENPDDTRGAWGDVKDWTVDTARALKKAKPLVVLVMHDREERDDDGTLITKLQLAGGAKDIFPGIPDVVMYTERRVFDDELEHTVAYFATSDSKVTKNRFKFPQAMADPSFTKMYEHIANNRKTKESNN